jgi:hypothetical protein
MWRLLPAKLAFAVGALAALSVPSNAQTKEPFRGSGTVTVTSVMPGDCTEDATYTVGGTAEPLGEFTGVGQQRVCSCEPPDIEGDVTFTAEAGNQLSLYYIGTRVGPTCYVCHVVATGGTGRYAGATVDAVLTIENYSPAGPFDLAWFKMPRFRVTLWGRPQAANSAGSPLFTRSSGANRRRRECYPGLNQAFDLTFDGTICFP